MLTIPKSQISDFFVEYFLTTEESKCFYIYGEIRHNADGQMVSYLSSCHDKYQCEHQKFPFLCRTSPVVHRHIDHRCSEGDGSFDDSSTHLIVAS